MNIQCTKWDFHRMTNKYKNAFMNNEMLPS